MARRITRTITLQVEVADAETQTEAEAKIQRGQATAIGQEQRRGSALVKQMRQEEKERRESEKKDNEERQARKQWIEAYRNDIKQEYDEQLEETRYRRLAMYRLATAKHLIAEQEKEKEEDENMLTEWMIKYEQEYREKLEEIEKTKKETLRIKRLEEEFKNIKVKIEEKVQKEVQERKEKINWIMKEMKQHESNVEYYNEYEMRRKTLERNTQAAQIQARPAQQCDTNSAFQEDTRAENKQSGNETREQAHQRLIALRLQVEKEKEKKSEWQKYANAKDNQFEFPKPQKRTADAAVQTKEKENKEMATQTESAKERLEKHQQMERDRKAELDRQFEESREMQKKEQEKIKCY